MEVSNGRCYYEVEDICDHRLVQGKTYYLIKWKMWPPNCNSWEPLENLHCPQILKRYHEQLANCNVVTSVNKWKAASGPATTTGSAIDRHLAERYKEGLLKNGCFIKRSGENGSTVNGSEIMMKKARSEKTQSPETVDHVYNTFLKDFDFGMTGGRWKFERITDTKFMIEFCGLNEDASAVAKRNSAKSLHFRRLKEWENVMNHACREKSVAPILVENFVDDQDPPLDFHYVLECVYREGVTEPVEAPFGCQCSFDCVLSQNCCPTLMDVEVPYRDDGILRIGPGRPIYECNNKCLCGTNCTNRIVQKGRRIKVAIFRTPDGRGWGVKTLEHISKGRFVMEYVGEVITNVEAERRGNAYDNIAITYLFDLDFFGDPEYVIDARYYGNESHFLNHSCDPNLQVYAVWIHSYNPMCPRIAFFSTRDIRPHEELTFDYMMNTRKGSSGSRSDVMECKCKSAKCRGNLYSKRARNS